MRLIKGFLGCSTVGMTITKLLQLITVWTDLNFSPIFSTIEFVSNFTLFYLKFTSKGKTNSGTASLVSQF